MGHGWNLGPPQGESRVLTTVPLVKWSVSDPMDCSSPGSSVHGVIQARILEWVAISFSRGSSRPGDWTSQADALPTEPSGKPQGIPPFTHLIDYSAAVWRVNWRRAEVEAGIPAGLNQVLRKFQLIWNRWEVSWIRSLGWPVYFTGFQKKKPTFSYLDNRVISLYNTFYYGFNNILKIFSVKNNYLQVPPPSNIYLFFPKNSSRLVRTNVSLRSEDCV